MAGQKIRIRLKSYDHEVIDQSAKKIVETVTNAGATVVGPVPLPTEKNVFCVIRSPHKYKDSREHFEMRTHKRLIDITKSTPKTVEALMALELSLEGNVFQPGEGMTMEDPEDTIAAVGRMGRVGMKSTDVEILNIMLGN